MIYAPLTRAMFDRHSAETIAMTGRKEPPSYAEISAHAVRQAHELLNHASKMERDREELIAALRDCNKPDTLPVDAAHVWARELLDRMESA